VVTFRPERASRLIGLDVPEDEQRGILTGLRFDVADDLQVTVPTWRARDVTREVDLVEEIARAVLDRVPHTMPRNKPCCNLVMQNRSLPLSLWMLHGKCC
jgi:phenylalanyl-tRNA synthetase beta subunit